MDDTQAAGRRLMTETPMTVEGLPGKLSNKDRIGITALFKLQSEYLDRMGSLFADEGETIAQFDNRLMAAQQHRDQLRIINALNAYSVDDRGTPRAVWRISKQDRDHIARHNPLGIICEANWTVYKSPLHGLVYGGADLLSLTSPPHEMPILDQFVRFYRTHPVPFKNTTKPDDRDNSDHNIALTRARNACRYLGNIASMTDWQQFNQMPLALIRAKDCGQRLAWMLQAISIERNGGIDPYATHPNFYRIAGETVCADIDLTYLDLHFQTLAKMQFPDIAMLLNNAAAD